MMDDSKQIELPNGKTYSFGPPSFSLELCELLEICKKMDSTNSEADSVQFMDFVSISIRVAYQSLRNGGNSEDEAKEALSAIPMNAEWLGKIRDVLGVS